jgi:uncharacterized protein YkwD
MKWLGLAAILAGCAGASPRTDEAVAAAAAAGTAQVVASVEAAERQRQAPRPQICGDYGNESTCYCGPVQDTGTSSAARMTLGEARAYTLMYLNGLRSLNGLGALSLDEGLNDFAQRGSEQLSRDHRPHGHFLDERGACPGCGEVQGDPKGWHVAPVQKQIDEILAGMMAEGVGGRHHDDILRPEWRRLGVGIVSPGERMYFTTDFAL